MFINLPKELRQIKCRAAVHVKPVVTNLIPLCNCATLQLISVLVYCCRVKNVVCFVPSAQWIIESALSVPASRRLTAASLDAAPGDIGRISTTLHCTYMHAYTQNKDRFKIGPLYCTVFLYMQVTNCLQLIISSTSSVI